MEPSSEKKGCCEKCQNDTGGTITPRIRACSDLDCPCHKKINNHSHSHSHSHCWDQKTPACGQPLEKHTQCCLCDMPYSEKETETKPQVSSSSVVGDKLDVKSQPEWVKEFDRMFKVLETATAVKSFKSYPNNLIRNRMLWPKCR